MTGFKEFGDYDALGLATLVRDGEVSPTELLDEAAEKQDIIITRHGKPAGVLIGFKSEDDWFDYRLESDPRFLDRVERARASLRNGRGVRLEDIDSE